METFLELIERWRIKKLKLNKSNEANELLFSQTDELKSNERLGTLAASPLGILW